MSKINTKAVREQAVNMMGDLKNLVSLYMENDQEVAGIEGNTIWSREYKNAQIKRIKERLTASARKEFDKLQEHLGVMVEVMRENDNIYDFSDPEFSSCIALLSASEKQLPYETIVGIADKFLGNRQALLALVEVAKGVNKDTLAKKVFNTEPEMESMAEKIIDIEINFPESICMIPMLKDKLVLLARACGEELTEEEQDMGADYTEIVMLQTRAAMGLPN